MTAIIISVLVTLAVVGLVVAIVFPTSNPYWTEPNCGGCVLFMVAATVLLCYAMMRLGAWLWA